MKKSLLICALLTISTAYAANTTLVTTINPGKPTAQVNVGFSESSFDYSETFRPSDKSICFQGDIKGVCPIIEKTSNDMFEAYKQGAHDSMDLAFCTIEGNVVETSYLLYDDYDTQIEVDRTIEACK